MATNDKLTTTIGYLAATLGTFMMLPQAYHSYVTKHVADISLGSAAVYLLQCLLWLVYGCRKRDVPIMLCNGIALCISVMILYLKIAYS